MDVVDSVNGVPIRLTAERWSHIVDNKPYMSAYYEKVISQSRSRRGLYKDMLVR